MLTVESVTKLYGHQTVLDNAAFEVARGQVLAVIGPNAAGKSTLIKCIMGLVRFDGRVTIGGLDVARDGRRARRLVGYLAQSPAFHPDLTVAETARFYGDLRGVAATQVRAAVDRMGLGGQAAKSVGALSGGMRQRLGLAVALMADPPLLILDEPAAGLDIAARLDLRGLVQEQKRAGTAVLLSTHWIEDVPYIADTALVLEQGRTTYLGPAAQMSGQVAPPSTLFLRVNGRGPDAVPVIEELTARHGAVERRGDWLVVPCAAGEKARVMERLVTAGIRVLDFRVEEAPADRLFNSSGVRDESP
jgi:ABC-type multidrug transport system ATPase subunit